MDVHDQLNSEGSNKVSFQSQLKDYQNKHKHNFTLGKILQQASASQENDESINLRHKKAFLNNTLHSVQPVDNEVQDDVNPWGIYKA